MHQEYFEIPRATVATIQAAKAEGKRVVALGTTVARTLEYANEALWQEPKDLSGEADIFIYPGYDNPGSEFRVVGAMLTNFHLPQSTLLMLVSAFAGKERVLEAYRHAVRQQYRFYSYGDCMFVE